MNDFMTLNDEEKDYYVFSKKEIEKYDMEKIKANVDDLLSNYKLCKFSYFASTKTLDNITSCYTPRYNQNCNFNDTLGNNVATKIDSSNFIKYVDEILQPLLNDLSPKERKYYSYCLVGEISERTFADSLKLSRTGIQPIKNNCLLKIALAFQLAVYKNY